MKRKQVAVLIYDGLCLFEFSCVAEIFGLERPEFGENWYQFHTMSLDGKPIKTQYKGNMEADLPILDWHDIDTIIVPGWTHIDQPVPKALASTLAKANTAGVRVMSICSGVFVLAAAGLLDGVAATTHWKYAETLQTRYPKIDVKNDVLFIDNEHILTSAGSAAGLDLCLHVVRKDYGNEIVNKVAKRLVIPPVRVGNQAQFIEQAVPKSKSHAIAPLLDKLRENLSLNYNNEQLAKEIHVTERTFLRRFKEATGTTPGEWLTQERIYYAKALLEQSDLSIDQVAVKSGFGTAMTLRHHFRLKMQISPQAYRKQFSKSVGL
ncbi:transcriptional regulator FtrA [Thalassotalea sp. M1531]|uniref:Transcriptional regulator FtrA n=2 Tax=Thalassotalea algicola TaxID=2716224 RepID=A0A7Y0LA91_9GAMM|nr:transcriptional regulator FtrA [Thalassotalea algicola]